MYSLYFNRQMHGINYIQILKACLRHVFVQVYHLQGKKIVSFENQFLIEIRYL
jgi:hypothetical protein